MKKWKSIRLMCLIGAVLLQMENMDALAAEPGGSDPGWICLDGKWYWQQPQAGFQLEEELTI